MADPAPPATRRRRVLVVGAGAAGLTAARELAADHDVVVVDKARGVGGRLATRRIGGATFDHGAQFFTTHSDRFAAEVARWESAGVAAPWFRSQVGPDGATGDDGHVRYRGVTTMTAVARHLARGTDVRLTTRVAALVAEADGWTATFDDNEALVADAVVCTAPVPQALDLLAAGQVTLTDGDASALRTIRYDPCLAALVPLSGPSGLPRPGAVGPDGGPVDWVADNEAKGVSAEPGVTIHASAAYSRERWDAPDATILGELVEASRLGSPPLDGPGQVQRWRYARPTVLHRERYLLARELPPLVFAGDAFGGAKVEGAVLSGLAAATAVADALARVGHDRGGRG